MRRGHSQSHGLRVLCSLACWERAVNWTLENGWKKLEENHKQYRIHDPSYTVSIAGRSVDMGGEAGKQLMAGASYFWSEELLSKDAVPS